MAPDPHRVYGVDSGQCAWQYGLPFDLLEAQVLCESSGDSYAFRYEPNFWAKYVKNNPDALGRKFGPLAACSLFVDRIGLAWGAKKMQALLSWAGGTTSAYPKALSAYNGGPARVIGPPFPNQTYVDAVYQLAGRAG